MGAQRRLPQRSADLAGRRCNLHRRRNAVRAPQALATRWRSTLRLRTRDRYAVYTTVADAVADEICQSWLAAWWAVASPYLNNQPTTEVAAYQAALLARFTNARMRDRLDRIAADGSQKLPIRILPVLRAERAAGRLPEAATRVLAAWICHHGGWGRESPTREPTKSCHWQPAASKTPCRA